MNLQLQPTERTPVRDVLAASGGVALGLFFVLARLQKNRMDRTIPILFFCTLPLIFVLGWFSLSSRSRSQSLTGTSRLAHAHTSASGFSISTGSSCTPAIFDLSVKEAHTHTHTHNNLINTYTHTHTYTHRGRQTDRQTDKHTHFGGCLDNNASSPH